MMLGPSMSHENGGADRDRTGDLKLAKLALSQLSYGPLIGSRKPEGKNPEALDRSARTSGFWPLGSGSQTWWAWVDSNYRPHAYQACALTT